MVKSRKRLANPRVGIARKKWVVVVSAMTRSFLPLLCLWLAFGTPARSDVIVSEIMYHPASENSREEFIELFNRENTAVNLAGWRFTSGIRFTFPNVTIAAGGYLVVAADLTTFNTKYSGVTNVVGGWLGTLSNSDEDIDLDDASGKRADSVRYAAEGDWAVRARGPLDHNHQGWIWVAQHDGGGKSMELINPDLSNNYGQNWAASITPGGTPGRPNSVARSNIAPLILQAGHFPIIPKSTDPVAVSARIVDEDLTGIRATLYYRVDGSASFTPVEMADDGAHGDGAAGDQFYGALLPPQANDTIIEFYLEARDRDGNVRTFPAPTQPGGGQSANLLYQVRDGAYSGSQPLYLLIMTEAERAELDFIGDTLPDALSDAQMNGTFISLDGDGTDVHYLAGIRNRGHGSRTARPNNYHLKFPSDHRWKGVLAINLNTQSTHAQLVGGVLFQKAGLPAADARIVQVRVNNANLAHSDAPQFGSYIAIESLDSDFTRHHFLGDPDGNVYRGKASEAPAKGEADLFYRGDNHDAYRSNYFKETNASEDDWSDLIALTRVLSGVSSQSYVQDVNSVLHIHEWLRYFALNALLDNNETGIYNGYGDDYGLYRGLADNRFDLLPYDHDTIMGEGSDSGKTNAGIFRATDLYVLERFLNGPELRPLYYAHLRGLIDSVFAPQQLNPMLDELLGSFVPSTTINAMKAWTAARNAYVLSILPPMVPMAGVWKFNQAGIDLGATWRTRDYDDSSWPEGKALFYSGAAILPAPKATPLTPGRVTYYFRSHFALDRSLSNNLAEMELKLAPIIDDGAVFYLNGTEILRLGMPAGSPAYTTLPNRVVATAGYEGPFTIANPPLIAGDNVLAVEVHQALPVIDDAVFGLKLDLSVAPQIATPSLVVLNEVFANNISVPESDGSTPDWLELYNRSDSAVDVSGSSLTDDRGAPRKWVFPSPTIVPSRGFLRVFFDDRAPASDRNTGFGISKNGDAVYWFELGPGGIRLLDSISFGLQAANFSIGRVSSTSTNWLLTLPTPGAPNLTAPTGNSALVRINEWLANPAQGDDWFEIYNPDLNPLALGGLFLSDNLNLRTEFRIAPLSFIGVGPYAFQKFEVGGGSARRANQTNFKLSASGEALAIFSADGTLIDGVTFTNQQAGVSEGRFPDGSANIIKFPEGASPGASNFLPLKLRVSVRNHRLVIAVMGAPGHTYTLQSRDVFDHGNWTTVREVVLVATPSVEFEESIPTGGQRFYRLISPP
jgi:hypothetical protein